MLWIETGTQLPTSSLHDVDQEKTSWNTAGLMCDQKTGCIRICKQALVVLSVAEQ